MQPRSAETSPRPGPRQGRQAVGAASLRALPLRVGIHGLGLAGLVLTGTVACNSTSSSTSASKDQATKEDNLREVSGREAKEMVQSGAMLLDVRTPGEFAEGHAEGAKNIPVSELEARVGELDATAPVVVYCHSGRRSHRAATLLEKRGFKVADLGSLSDWPGSKATGP